MSIDLPADPATVTRPFPVAPGMGPPEEYHELRSRCPMAKVQVIGEVPELDTTGWFVTRYEDVRALLGDRRFIRPDVNDWPRTPDDWPPVEPDMATIMELEGERHDTLRRLVSDAFGTGAVRARAGRTREIADELLDELVATGRPGDLVAGYADPLPVRVMCELTGVPPEAAPRFEALARHLLFSVDLDDDDEDITAVVRDEVLGWMDLRRREPGDDVLSDLVRRLDAGELTEHDVLCFGRAMIIAGFLPSQMFLANAILALLTHPGELAALRADPDLMAGAVEELLRWVPVFNGNIFLIATEDVPLGDRVIREGELVMPVVAAANRDGTVFPEADRLDVRRSPNPHLAFGRGVHNCLGAQLTRVTFAVALRALLDRLPGLALAVDPDEVPWPDPRRKFRSPVALPVTWS
ncbi:MAG TPA: cytochrome P450 [Pseudonocardiaceae bacterium]